MLTAGLVPPPIRGQEVCGTLRTTSYPAEAALAGMRKRQDDAADDDGAADDGTDDTDADATGLDTTEAEDIVEDDLAEADAAPVVAEDIAEVPAVPAAPAVGAPDGAGAASLAPRARARSEERATCPSAVIQCSAYTEHPLTPRTCTRTDTLTVT